MYIYWLRTWRPINKTPYVLFYCLSFKIILCMFILCANDEQMVYVLIRVKIVHMSKFKPETLRKIIINYISSGRNHTYALICDAGAKLLLLSLDVGRHLWSQIDVQFRTCPFYCFCQYGWHHFARNVFKFIVFTLIKSGKLLFMNLLYELPCNIFEDSCLNVNFRHFGFTQT